MVAKAQWLSRCVLASALVLITVAAGAADSSSIPSGSDNLTPIGGGDASFDAGTVAGELVARRQYSYADVKFVGDVGYLWVPTYYASYMNIQIGECDGATVHLVNLIDNRRAKMCSPQRYFDYPYSYKHYHGYSRNKSWHDLPGNLATSALVVPSKYQNPYVPGLGNCGRRECLLFEIRPRHNARHGVGIEYIKASSFQ